MVKNYGLNLNIDFKEDGTNVYKFDQLFSNFLLFSVIDAVKSLKYLSRSSTDF